MSIKWSGRLRGTLLGYKFFVFLIRYIGLSGAYFLLVFVSFYFLLFSTADRNAIYKFYRQKMGYGKFKSVWFCYKNFFVFGQTIIDRVAIFSKAGANFNYHFDGQHYLQQMIAEGKGGMIISAHIGNFEVAGHFLRRLNAKINLITTGSANTPIKDYLDSVMVKQSNSFIFVKPDMTHVFEINEALKNNELICFTGDRFYDKTKTISATLFGEEAKFPAGPFHLATRYKIPYLFVFTMKEPGRRYHFYATPSKINEGSINDIVNEYAQTLESIARKYPEQWFNYYNFWAA